ncbi:type II secretion system F family protein [Virgibacillus sp. MSP4-1]|uniref:type II secretion system F family protein n=1 Tax=Virgibacillus sp. MSP4-1 TaxID=2700081 RepID=UPI00039D3DC4|nr:type II secretion system F family protein [Virgibacillus sp. MSP4-1]QHS22498.1 type II secretion system F family protein [Virgibacillus sp. MSP4-1]
MAVFLLWMISFAFFSILFLTVQISVHQNKLQIDLRLMPFVDTSRSVEPEEDKELSSFKMRILSPLAEKFRGFILKRTPKHKLQDLENKLRDAGNPFGLTSLNFILLRLILTVGFILLLWGMFLPSADQMAKLIFISIFAALFIHFYANYYITAKKKQRVIEIEKSMPDFFDMVTVSIEAGMGLDSALRRVCKQMDGPLSKEFLYALEDMKLGKSRKNALTDLRNRVASEFLKSVISAIIQADQMGIGMSKVLQAQTQRIREQQRQKVKEQAMKAPVKMLIPMVLFIFPTLFIVLLGPAVIQLIQGWN